MNLCYGCYTPVDPLLLIHYFICLCPAALTLSIALEIPSNPLLLEGEPLKCFFMLRSHGASLLTMALLLKRFVVFHIYRLQNRPTQY